MAKMPKEVIDLFNDPQASKVIATISSNGIPNVAAKQSLISIDEETIAFAEIADSKTGANLQANKKVAIAVFKMPPSGYQIKGTFQGFMTSGPLYDQFARVLKERANVDTKWVGTIKVEEVYSNSVADYGKRIV